MPTFIPATVQAPLVALLGLVALGWVALLYVAHLRHNRQRQRAGEPLKTTLAHVRGHAAHHSAAGALLVIAVFVALGAGVTVALLYQGGFSFNPHRHIPPHARPVPLPATSAPYVSPNLFAAGGMVPYVVNQGQTNSCCGQTMAEIDTLNRALRYGEHPPVPDSPISGFKPWYYAAGGQNVGTTVESERDAYNAHGLEGLAYWPLGGVPDAQDAAHTYTPGGAAISYDFYQDGGGGAAGLSDIENRLDHRQPVGLIWHVPNTAFRPGPDGFLPPGGGQTVFYHCLIAVQWTSNYAGHGPAVLLWNHWGTAWGLGGFAWMGAADVKSEIDGAWIETPGPRLAAFAPHPRPPLRPTPLPLPPTKRPAPPTAVPRAPRHPLFAGIYVVVRATNLRARPSTSAPITAGLAPSLRLRSLGAQTPHWARVQFARAGGRWVVGWAMLSALARSPR